MKKYELTKETVTISGKTLYRIRAVRDFGSVKTGEFGGYIEKEENLSHFGDAWVYGNAKVSGKAWVRGNAEVSGNAKVRGNAWICGNAKVSGNAEVSGNAKVSGNARVSGNAEVSNTRHYFVQGPIAVSLHISEPTRQAENTYAVFCLKKKHHAQETVLQHFWRPLLEIQNEKMLEH